MKKNIHIHIFTYSGDSYIIRETVMCAVQALPEAHVVEMKRINPALLKSGGRWRIWGRSGVFPHGTGEVI